MSEKKAKRRRKTATAMAHLSEKLGQASYDAALPVWKATVKKAADDQVDYLVEYIERMGAHGKIK